MADRTVKVITPADCFDFLTVQEAKTMLGLTVTTSEEDEQIAMMITNASATIARLCNRMFAYEEVEESWREVLPGHRLFLSHWPIKPEDVDLVSVNGSSLELTAWDLEPQSGKMSNYNGWGAEPVVVVYSGGYKLPDEAPPPLKRAAMVLIREERIMMRQAQVAGIRQIAHKESRVSFFDPNAVLISQAGGKMSQTESQLYSLLYHYIRVEV